jgi:hypothetical protein
MCERPTRTPAVDEDQAAERPTIAQIFREYGPAYRAKHAQRMTSEQLRVMGQLQRCRTGELGQAWYRCDNCGTVHAMPQSCGNRHCPQCQGHPHLHFIVPGGALSDDGQRWMPSRVNFFVPVKAASPIYRAKFLDCLAASGLADQARQALGDKPWVVHSKAVGDGQRALRYLAPYVYRVAISNRRLVKCEPGPDGLGRVTFTYRKSGSRRWRTMTVTADEFIRRFLQHVLPMTFLGFVPGPPDSVIIHDSS